MSQLPLPTNVGSSGTSSGLAPRRLAQSSPSVPHTHHVNHSPHSHPLGHSSNSPMLRANHGHSHIHTELDTTSITSSRFDMDWEAKEVLIFKIQSI